MAWNKVAGSCDHGPCPTFHRDDANGAMRVQANIVAPHVEIPGFEGMVEMQESDWRNLIRQYLAQFPL